MSHCLGYLRSDGGVVKLEIVVNLSLEISSSFSIDIVVNLSLKANMSFGIIGLKSTILGASNRSQYQVWAGRKW